MNMGLHGGVSKRVRATEKVRDSNLICWGDFCF